MTGQTQSQTTTSDKQALGLSLVDDLFRNRFFTAIGNKDILETTLIREAGSFANIHDLIRVWHDSC